MYYQNFFSLERMRLVSSIGRGGPWFKKLKLESNRFDRVTPNKLLTRVFRPTELAQSALVPL